jgi:hypothetical protein
MIPTHRRIREGDCEFKVIMGYTELLSPNKTTLGLFRNNHIFFPLGITILLFCTMFAQISNMVRKKNGCGT